MSYFMFELRLRKTLSPVSKISLSFIFCLLSPITDVFRKIRPKLESSSVNIFFQNLPNKIFYEVEKKKNRENLFGDDFIFFLPRTNNTPVVNPFRGDFHAPK